MSTVVLGRSGVEVSRIAYGSGPLAGAMGHLDEATGIRAVQHALDLGVTLFDTGRTYGGAEELLGRALRDVLGRDRESVVLATKGGVRAIDPPAVGLTRDSSRAALRADLETSLRTLGVDHVDIYQVHWPDSSTPFAETADALLEMVDEGRIRHIGVSNFSAAQLAEFDGTALAGTHQIAYGLFHRQEEADAIPYALEHDVGILAYGVLSHGMLRSDAPFDPGRHFGEIDWRRNHGLFQPQALERNLRTAAELGDLAAEHGWSLPQMAIAWALGRPGVHVAIIGTANPAHIEEAVAAQAIELTPDILEEIERIMRTSVDVPFFTLEDV